MSAPNSFPMVIAEINFNDKQHRNNPVSDLLYAGCAARYRVVAMKPWASGESYSAVLESYTQNAMGEDSWKNEQRHKHADVIRAYIIGVGAGQWTDPAADNDNSAADGGGEDA